MTSDAVNRVHQLAEAISPQAGGICQGFSTYVWGVLSAVGHAMAHLEQRIEHETMCRYLRNPDALVKAYAVMLVEKACEEGRIQLPEDWRQQIRMMTRRPMPSGRYENWMQHRDPDACWLVLLAQGEMRQIFAGADRDLVRRSYGAALFSHYTTGDGWCRLPALCAPEFLDECAGEWVKHVHGMQRDCA